MGSNQRIQNRTFLHLFVVSLFSDQPCVLKNNLIKNQMLLVSLLLFQLTTVKKTKKITRHAWSEFVIFDSSFLSQRQEETFQFIYCLFGQTQTQSSLPTGPLCNPNFSARTSQAKATSLSHFFSCQWVDAICQERSYVVPWGPPF